MIYYVRFTVNYLLLPFALIWLVVGGTLDLIRSGEFGEQWIWDWFDISE